jgi:molybdenum cofactor cytidylyltransferase
MKRYAILPAAGRSRRMGEPKLLLPWGPYPTMLQATLASWQGSPVDEIVVVAHPDDEKVHQIVRQAGATLVIPAFVPREMKISIREGLRWLKYHRRPQPTDVWLLAPADTPQLSSPIIKALIDRHSQAPESILVPCHGGYRGHPVLFPWVLAEEVERLGAEEGVNALLQRHVPVEVQLPDPRILEDVDTPDDYRRLQPPAC